MKVNAGLNASIPTSPLAYEPSVVKVNWETPFRKTSRVFPLAVSRHLSPERIRGAKERRLVKLPSGFTLKSPDCDGLSAQRNSSHPVCPVALRSIRTIGPPPPVATVPSVTSEYCLGGGAMLQAPEALCPPSLPMATPAFLNPD
jgi:hypothetical protein